METFQMLESLGVGLSSMSADARDNVTTLATIMTATSCPDPKVSTLLETITATQNNHDALKQKIAELKERKQLLLKGIADAKVHEKNRETIRKALEKEKSVHVLSATTPKAVVDLSLREAIECQRKATELRKDLESITTHKEVMAAGREEERLRRHIRLYTTTEETQDVLADVMKRKGDDDGWVY
eukprot:PhF_6_TR4178/c0_g1_i2/m.5612